MLIARKLLPVCSPTCLSPATWVAFAFMERVEMIGHLFGDILAVGPVGSRLMFGAVEATRLSQGWPYPTREPTMLHPESP